MKRLMKIFDMTHGGFYPLYFVTFYAEGSDTYNDVMDVIEKRELEFTLVSQARTPATIYVGHVMDREREIERVERCTLSTADLRRTITIFHLKD